MLVPEEENSRNPFHPFLFFSLSPSTALSLSMCVCACGCMKQPDQNAESPCAKGSLTQIDDFDVCLIFKKSFLDARA